MEDPLQGPYEIFDIGDGESEEWEIVSWEAGSMVIHPRARGAVPEKIIEGLRIYLKPEPAKPGLDYRDLTAKTLIAQLRPILEKGTFEGRKIRVRKFGVAPTARFTVEVI